MILKSFSKINLSLNVNKKLKNNLHDIQSYFCQIDLSDRIEINRIKGQRDKIYFKGKFTKHINKRKNSILNTLRLLRKNKLISNFYSVLIKKNIPVYAGLGGGTSNAAYLVKHFLRNNNSKTLLKFFSNKLGSDIRLFFHHQGFLKNLNAVEGFKKRYMLNFLLVKPNFNNSTKYIYSQVKRYSSKKQFFTHKIDSKRKFIKLLSKQCNDLQLIVENKYPLVKKLLDDISQNKGCYFSRMSGSGSVCYGVFKSKKTAHVALFKIKKKYPKFWASLAKTI